MFARTVTVKGKKYYRIVENFRVNGKVKQAYVCSCEPEGVGEENADSFLAAGDSSPDIELLLKDNPKIKRLVRSLQPGHAYENRRKGIRDETPFVGRTRIRKCPSINEKVTLREERNTGLTICPDSRNGKVCKNCVFINEVIF